VALLVLVLGGCDAPGVSGACGYEAPWCSRGRVAADSAALAGYDGPAREEPRGEGELVELAVEMRGHE
jgi:hypothetical protein